MAVSVYMYSYCYVLLLFERGACEHEALVSVVRYDRYWSTLLFFVALLCFECAVDRGHRQTDSRQT